MINHKHKIIFIHVPRTGGISIRTALESVGVTKDTHFAHLCMKHYHNSLHKNGRDIKQYYKFTCVRNVYERLSSMVFHKSDGQWNQDRLRHMIREKGKSYSSTCYYIGDHTQYDRIIQFDNIQEGFDEVMKDLGFPQTDLGILNSSNHNNYETCLQPDDISNIKKHYKDEIMLFDWKPPGMTDEEFMKQAEPNDFCPCGSSTRGHRRKYKKCCGK